MPKGSGVPYLPVVLMLLALVLTTSTRSAMAEELVSLSIESGGRTRTWLLYAPPGASAKKVQPLVIVLHGGYGTGKAVVRQSHFDKLAAKKGFFAAFPDAYHRQWNDGRGIPNWPAQRENIDDVGFISDLIDHMRAKYPIDPKRVYATGISNGGLMSHRLGCELSNKIAAIATVVRTMTVSMARTCRPGRAVPMLMFFGTADPFVPFQGGEQDMRTIRIKTLSARETIEFWAKNNGCAATPVTTEIAEAADHERGITVRRESYPECRDGAEVVAYIQEGAGHTWPGGYMFPSERALGVGKTNRKLDATGIIWEFFRDHPMR